MFIKCNNITAQQAQNICRAPSTLVRRCTNAHKCPSPAVRKETVSLHPTSSKPVICRDHKMRVEELNVVGVLEKIGMSSLVKMSLLRKQCLAHFLNNFSLRLIFVVRSLICPCRASKRLKNDEKKHHSTSMLLTWLLYYPRHIMRNNNWKFPIARFPMRK